MEKKKLSKGLKIAVTAIVVLVPIIFCTSTLDSDIWFQINHGRYLLENGLTFSEIEPFTCHEGFAFSFEKWLTCIIFWLVYNTFGPNGLFVLVCALSSLTSYLLYRLCMKVSKENWQVSLVNTVLIMIPYTYLFARPRPQMFSMILMLIEVYVLECWQENQNHKLLFILPVLSCLYMQLHSTMWPMFFICILPYLCDFSFLKYRKVEGSSNAKLPLIFCFIGCLLAGLINPYGIKSCIYLVKSLMGGNFAYQIAELQRTTVGSLFRLSMVIFPQLFSMIFTDKKIPLRYFYFIFGTLLMALVAVRNQEFYLVFAGFITAYFFEDLYLDKPFVEKLVVLGLVGSLLGASAVAYYRMAMRDPYAATDHKAIIDELVEKYDAKGKTIYTDFSYGNYCEFAGLRAYLDARAEVFIPEINGKEDILREYEDLRTGKIHYSTLQQKYDFDYWLVIKGTLLETYMCEDTDYQVVLEDDNYVILSYLPE